ncbi:hypothetical protein ACCW92_22480, partial [Enterobacter soli]|uniref:hypothetical protein n=1 Tax=Enterobacter soli TaxID=885040 RepID=UPI003ED9CD27
NNPVSRLRKSPLRGGPQRIPSGFSGMGAMKRPCKSCPLGASLRVAPAYRKRFGDFQPDSRTLHHLSGL